VCRIRSPCPQRSGLQRKYLTGTGVVVGECVVDAAWLYHPCRPCHPTLGDASERVVSALLGRDMGKS